MRYDRILPNQPEAQEVGISRSSERIESSGTSVLVTGATGYIGGRLIPRLIHKGYRVRILVRDPSRIDYRPWANEVDVHTGDLFEPSPLQKATEGMDAAYYLVHSMSSEGNYADSDRRAATNFVEAGKDLRRVIYLGGLVPDGPAISQHLSSRAEVGQILRDGLPTLELRAGPIVGSGSASFEMVRYLTERLPIIIGPSWMKNEVQPIAVRDMISYLTQAMDREITGVLEVGGDRISFQQMLENYAAARGLKRLIVRVKPIIPPRFAASSVGLVTGLPRSLTAALLEGIIHPVVADTTEAKRLFPEIVPLSNQTAVDLALTRTRERMVETNWRGSIDQRSTYRRTDREGSSRETRSVWIQASPKRVFEEVNRLSGKRNWLTGAWGHWNVEASESPNLLRLHVQMSLPGEAWLQFETIPEEGGTRLVQRLLFEPAGLLGVAYWHSFYPMRRLLFANLVRTLAKAAEVTERRHHPQRP